MRDQDGDASAGGGVRGGDLGQIVDASELGRLQKTVLWLCGLAALLDGFDTQAIGFAAPAIVRALDISPAALGPVFAAGTVGITIGAFAMGPIADRVGRRLPLIVCVVWFAVFTLMTPLATSLPQLLILRAVAGLGLGGAMPSFIALAAEYTPTRMRNVVVSGLYAAFPLGGMIGGLLGAYVIPTFGWQVIFMIGGTAPLALAAALLFLLPESARFLVARGRKPQEARRIASAISGRPLAEDAVLTLSEPAAGGSLKALFGRGYAGQTLVLWGAFFLAYMVLLTVGVWSTTILNDAGVGIANSLLVVSCNYLGGVIGSVVIGRIMDRFKSQAVLWIGFLAGAAFLVAFGQATASAPLMAILLAGAGFCIAGPASGLIAVAAQRYSTEIRSTGVGWAMGMGRVGQILGPLGISALVAAGWRAPDIFIAAAVPCVLAALLMMVLRRGAPA